MEIRELSQESGEVFRRLLSGDALENVRQAFTGEETRLQASGVWAYPPQERIYYLVFLEGSEYLVGVNPNATPKAVNISSFARVTPEPKGQAAVCLRHLIEQKLVGMCRVTDREAIVVLPTTERARRVLEHLRANKPSGIGTIKIKDTGAYCMRVTRRLRGR